MHYLRSLRKTVSVATTLSGLLMLGCGGGGEDTNGNEDGRIVAAAGAGVAPFQGTGAQGSGGRGSGIVAQVGVSGAASAGAGSSAHSGSIAASSGQGGAGNSGFSAAGGAAELGPQAIRIRPEGGAGTGSVSGSVAGSTATAGSGAVGGVSAIAGSAGQTTAGSTGSLNATVGARKVEEGQVALSGLTTISYGGYLNGESFQQDGIVSHNGYQYSAFWNDKNHVVLVRRKLPSGAWEKFEFTDYTLSAADAHNTISLGIAPADGTLHLSFDHHGSPLHYRKSVADLVSKPDSATWAATSFSTVTNALVANSPVSLVTYPRFITEPGGEKMLFSARIGESGSGDEYLWEYNATSHSWISLGKYIDGISDSINAYLHGISYSRGGSRLHASWCWRDTPNASTNHDLLYIYSDDHGRTWNNNAGTRIGTTGSVAVDRDSNGVSVVAIGQNRGLINQEHMAVDTLGRVHVLLSHMQDSAASQSNFDTARDNSQYFHYWRDTNGTWTRTGTGFPVIDNLRGKLAISSTNNLYAVLPDLRIIGASVASNYATWTLLSADSGRFFSDPLIDTARLESEDHLTIYFPQKSSPNIWNLEFEIQ